jgi:hypothetical protein
MCSRVQAVSKIIQCVLHFALYLITQSAAPFLFSSSRKYIGLMDGGGGGGGGGLSTDFKGQVGI